MLPYSPPPFQFPIQQEQQQQQQQQQHQSSDEIPQTPEGLLRWSIENSTPENQAQVDNTKLMTHEEFKELWNVAFPDELKVLKENLQIIENKPTDIEQLHLALDKILFIVEGIDQADWFADLNGFELIFPYLFDANSETRMAAAWIYSNALQNNPKVQKKFQNRIGINKIISVLKGENVEKAAKRKVGMIMSAVRGYKPLKEEFYNLDGFSLLLPICEEFPSLYSRLTWFVSALLDEEDPYDKEELNKMNIKQLLLDHQQEIDDDELLDVVISRL